MARVNLIDAVAGGARVLHAGDYHFSHSVTDRYNDAGAEIREADASALIAALTQFDQDNLTAGYLGNVRAPESLRQIAGRVLGFGPTNDVHECFLFRVGTGLGYDFVVRRDHSGLHFERAVQGRIGEIAGTAIVA